MEYKFYIILSIIALYTLTGFQQENDSARNNYVAEEVNSKNDEIGKLKKEAIIRERKFGEESILRNILFVFIIVIICSFFLLYHKYQLKQYNKYQIKINEQQNELFTAIISIQDNERKRIAEDLHDGLGSILSAAKLNLTRLQDEPMTLSEIQENKYQSSISMLDEAIVELRNISHNIMPASLSKLGLVVALKNLFDTISSHSGLLINFTSHAINQRFNESSEINIYRIILELINNIVKHASAKEVTVQLIQYPEYINIAIEDNGKGFNYGQAKSNKKGIGLTNISSRVDFMKGKLDIDSAEGRGTTVFIEIPLKEIQLNG